LLLYWFLLQAKSRNYSSFKFNWRSFTNNLSLFLSRQIDLSSYLTFYLLFWSLLIPITYNHHFGYFFFLLQSGISKHCSVLFVGLIKIHFWSWKRGVFSFYLFHFWLRMIVVATVHNHILNCSLPHFISACNISNDSLHRRGFLTANFFRSISIYSPYFIPIIIWI